MMSTLRGHCNRLWMTFERKRLMVDKRTSEGVKIKRLEGNEEI